MNIEKFQIAEFNDSHRQAHERGFEYLAGNIQQVDDIVQKLQDFQVAIPSWALGTTHHEFGRAGVVVQLRLRCQEVTGLAGNDVALRGLSFLARSTATT